MYMVFLYHSYLQQLMGFVLLEQIYIHKLVLVDLVVRLKDFQLGLYHMDQIKMKRN